MRLLKLILVMKNIFIYLILLINFNCLAQVKKIIVDYTLYFAEPNNLTNNEMDKIMKGIYKKNGLITYKLYVNDSVSYFVDNEGLNSSDLLTSLATNKSLYDTPIFSDLSKKKIYYSNSTNFIFFKKNQYLIEHPVVSNWSISSENKIIDNKVCYKATSIDNYYFHTKDKKIEFEITAWFCPEIPVSAGPVFFNNLPGLILEISYLDVRLYATRIEFIETEKFIKKPEGKTIVNYEEYVILEANKIEEMTKQINSKKN